MLSSLTHWWRIRRLTRAVAVSRKVDPTTKLAHVIRHLGDAHRHAGRMAAAEPCYVEALALYRGDAGTQPLDLANALRGLAVLKDALGRGEESKRLWEEAHGLYAGVRVTPGVAECAARLALLAARDGDSTRSRDWLGKAAAAAESSGDPDTMKYVGAVRSQVSS